MAIENRSTADGAVSSPSSTYSSRGVFNNDGEVTTESGSSSSSTSETTLTPSTGGGTGGNANDTPITMAAGTGLAVMGSDGTNSFTTNQATAETITYTLTDTGITAGTFGNVAQSISIESITVDAQGRISDIQTTTVPPQPAPFNDNFQSSSDAPPTQSASETPVMETITLTVGEGYNLNADMAITTRSIGTVTPIIGDPTITDGGRTATIPVTIPAVTMSTDMTGSVRVETTSIVTETDTGRVMTEVAIPLNTQTFIPFYNMIFNGQQTSLTLAQLTASTSALTNGTSVSFTYNTSGPRRQYGYLALERVENRTYQFDAGFFDISTDPTGMTAEMFGRTYDFYEFPTQSNLSFTIRW